MRRLGILVAFLNASAVTRADAASRGTLPRQEKSMAGLPGSEKMNLLAPVRAGYIG